MRNIDKISKDFVKALTDGMDKKTKPYDASAKVLRVENGIAWVHISGGVDETPAKLTLDAKPGDEVQVRVGGGSAWLTGNLTGPPTDNSKVATIVKENTKKGTVEAKTISEEKLQYCLCNEKEIPNESTFESIRFSQWLGSTPDYVEGKYFWVRHVYEFTDGTFAYGYPYFDGGTQYAYEKDYQYTHGTAYMTGKVYDISLSVNDWDVDLENDEFGYYQTINVFGVTSQSVIQWAPNVGSIKECSRVGLVGVSSSLGTMTFGCDKLPTSQIEINILVYGNVQ